MKAFEETLSMAAHIFFHLLFLVLCTDCNYDLNLSNVTSNNMSSSKCNKIPGFNHVFRLTKEEERKKRFHVVYSSASNWYARLIDSLIVEEKQYWWSWIYKAKYIYQHIQHGSKIICFSRPPFDHTHAPPSTGVMQWKFDFGNSKIKSINLLFAMKTFKNASVIRDYLDGYGQVTSYEKIIGTNRFSIRAIMVGGYGSHSWMMAQVLPQSMFSKAYSFQVIVNFF